MVGLLVHEDQGVSFYSFILLYKVIGNTAAMIRQKKTRLNLLYRI